MPVNFDTFCGIAKANVDEINGTALNAIDDLAGITGASLFSKHYTFNGQTTNVTTSGPGWSPTGDMSGWASGTDCTSASNNLWVQNQTQQQAGLSTTKTATGWRIDFNATGSGRTGPDGAHAGFDGGNLGAHDTSSNTKYAYTEATGILDTNNLYLMRTPGFVFKNEMSSASNNLDLKFYAHMYGSRPGTLQVYIDDAASSSSDTATLLTRSTGSYNSSTAIVVWSSTASTQATSITPATATYTSTSSNWVEYVISLNHYRTSQVTNYIYFVYEADNFFTSDFAIDDVRFIES